MKRRLSRIRTPWRRCLVRTAVSTLCILNRFTHPPARFHWIAPSRARRLERPLFGLLLISALVLLEPHEFVLWSAIGGGGISIFLVLYMLYRFFPRKRAHRVREGWR
jgi:hypothetical protein